MARCRLAEYLVLGRNFVKNMYSAKSLEMPDSLSSPAHWILQDALLQTKHSMDMLQHKHAPDSFKDVGGALKLKVEGIFADCIKDILMDGQTQFDAIVKKLENVSTQSLVKATEALSPLKGGLGSGLRRADEW